MPKFSVETSYKIPVFRLRQFEAASIEEACRLALEDDNWENAARDYDSATPSSVTGVWPAGAEYVCFSLPIPQAFEDPLKRKADHFEILVSLLAEIAGDNPPRGTAFEDWLARVKDTLAKPNVIANANCVPLASCPSPKHPTAAD
jgi:hypothetical protein